MNHAPQVAVGGTEDADIGAKRLRLADAAAPLLRLLRDDSPRVRFFAAQSLGKLKLKPAVGPLFEALRMNAACAYGLGASLFTRNLAAVSRLAAAIRAGNVVVNDAIVATAHPATPFGVPSPVGPS